MLCNYDLMLIDDMEHKVDDQMLYMRYYFMYRNLGVILLNGGLYTR